MAHLKRLATPKSWPVTRKILRWAVRPSPGPHGKLESIPVLTVLRDVLKVCDTRREAQSIITAGGALVDGARVRDGRRGIGFMDVLTLAATNSSYRVLIDRKGRLQLEPVDPESAKWKLVRVTSKRTIRGGGNQLGLHDGRTIRTDDRSIQCSDVLKLGIPDQKILGRFAWGTGGTAYLVGGAHVGELGRIENIEVNRSSRPDVVVFGEGFRTIVDYAFLVGGTTPAVKPPEAIT